MVISPCKPVSCCQANEQCPMCDAVVKPAACLKIMWHTDIRTRLAGKGFEVVDRC